MSENSGLESFENNEKTKEQVIEEVKALGGFESDEAKEVFGKWIDQEQAKTLTGDDRFLVNRSIAEVYLGVGDIENAIEAYEDALSQAEHEGREASASQIREKLYELDELAPIRRIVVTSIPESDPLNLRNKQD